MNAKTFEDDTTLDGTAEAMTNLLGLWRSGGTLAQAMDLSDDECEALYTLGHSLYQQGKYADAFKVFAQVTAYNHLESRYQAAAGAAAQMLGRYEDALRHYMAVTVMRLDDPVPPFHCAECLLAMGKVAEAVESLDLVFELSQRDEQKHAALVARARTLLAAIEAKTKK